MFEDSPLHNIHYIGEIPAPPAPYIAHPYTLLPIDKVAGRKTQLDLLTEWVTATDHKVRVLNVVAIGGMGKSALTWKWFNESAPQAMNPLAGRMWWSFYESDAYFENFVIRALAYVTRSPEAEIREITPAERERELLEILDREPYLIVMDGLERILIAYARLDAARLDDDALDEETANAVAGALGVPAHAQQTVFSANRLRKTADPRAGAFLRKLTQINASRILVSTRLYPADLQRITGHPVAGSFAVFLGGLEDADALALWQSFGVSGEPSELLPIFKTFDNYPLLIRALAGAVAHTASGDFAAWRRANPGFRPERQRAEAVKAHVMSYAVAGLSKTAHRVLNTIAAFRMPVFYDALAKIAAQDAQGDAHSPRSPEELDAALAELEARGLVGCDHTARRYDLHPIVRGVAWGALDEQARRGLYSILNAHFGALPAVSVEDVRSLEDLTAPIELYNTLIGLEKYDEAFVLYAERLNLPMLRRLSASLQRIELLEALFPDGLDKLPRLSRPAAQARALNALGLAYQQSGQPARAVPIYFRATSLAEQENHIKNVSIGLANMADTLRLSGQLRAAHAAANRALIINRAQDDRAGEALSLQLVGLVNMARGAYEAAETALRRARRIQRAQGNPQAEGVTCAFLAQLALWRGDLGAARELADAAWALADTLKYEADYIRAAQMQGAAAFALTDWATADERLTHALTRARAVNLEEQELPALVALAELRWQSGSERAARGLLDDLWEAAERGPYRLVHADAYDLLTRIERTAGNAQAAKQTATAAYYLSWCDGEPYAYQRGLEAARAHLTALGVPEPDDLPPFSEARYGPMLDAEIDPPDEFGPSGQSSSAP